jgi:hypothetical protein
VLLVAGQVFTPEKKSVGVTVRFFDSDIRIFETTHTHEQKIAFPSFWVFGIVQRNKG